MDRSFAISTKWGSEIGKKLGIPCMAQVRTGPTSAVFSCLVQDNATWPALNAAFGEKIMGDPEMGALFATTTTECYTFGQLTQDTWASLFPWEASVKASHVEMDTPTTFGQPGATFTFMPHADSCRIGKLSNGKGFQGMNEIVYKDPCVLLLAHARTCALPPYRSTCMPTPYLRLAVSCSCIFCPPLDS